jgi:NADPH:quinone reductase-like Zn-dependent oxidoreductase
MKAAVYERYGAPDVVHIQEIAQPTPKDDEVLVRVRATTVSTADWRARTLEVPRGFGVMARLVFGLFGPRKPILGTELAGEVVAVGNQVRQLKVGDAVVAFSGIGLGCHAEYRCVRESGVVVRKPANLSFDEAAALSFGGMTALSFLRRGNIRSGHKVLINGASGAVGTAAVQLAKHFGAEVTAVCSGANLALVKSIGADHVIDYTREDLAQRGETWDIIMDTVGTAPFSRSRRALAGDGRLLLVLATLSELLQAPWVALTSKRRVIVGPAPERVDDLRVLATLAEAGALKPVIDRRYPLDRIVEAHAYVAGGHKRGSVVITV